MKRKILLLVCFLALALLISLCAVACDGGKTPEESTSGEITTSADTGTTAGTTNTDTEESNSKSSDTTDTTATEAPGSQTTETSTADGTSETQSDESSDVSTAPINDEYPVDENEETEGEIDNGNNSDLCHPRFEYNYKYHWTPACDKTTGLHKNPISKGVEMSHTIYCNVENEGDIILYSYICTRCSAVIERVEVPYDMALYLDPWTMAEAKHEFGGAEDDMIITDGTEKNPIVSLQYTSADGIGSTALTFYDETTSSPTGKYLVMKVKLNDGRNQIMFNIASIEAWKNNKKTGGAITVSLGGLTPGWSTVIVDLTKLVQDGQFGYVPSADGEYYLNKFELLMDGTSALAKGQSFQVAYVGFCDSIDIARNFAKDEKVRYIFNDAMATGLPSSTDGMPCVHVYNKVGTTQHYSAFCDVCLDVGGTVDHKYSFIPTRNENGDLIKYQLECICGEKTKEYSAPADVNMFTAPTSINVDVSWHGSTNKQPYVDGSTLYQRIITTGDKNSGNGATVSLTTKGTLKFTESKGGSGKFLIFKIRTHDVGYLALKLASLTEQEYNNMTESQRSQYIPDGYPNERKWEHDDQWITLVVDIEVVAANGKTNYKAVSADAAYIYAGLQIRDAETTGNTEQAYVDVAYAAICDNWQEVSQVADSETVIFTPWIQGAPFIEATKDGDLDCPAHNGKGVLSADGKTVTYKCMICGVELGTVSIPEVGADALNYVSLPGQLVSNYNAGIAVSGEDGVVFSRINFGVSGQARLHNTFGATGKMKNVDDDIVGGPGKLAVIKLRFGGTSLGQLKIGLYDGNKPLNTNHPYSQNNPNTDAIFESSATIRTISQTMVDGGWIIYVVDISSLNQTYYDVLDTETNKISLGLKIENGKGGKDTDYIDLAYFAIADTWDEVKTMLAGETSDFEFVPVWNDESTDATRTHEFKCVDHAIVNIDTNVNTNGGQNADVCYTCDRATGCENPYCTEYSVSDPVFTEVPHVLKTTSSAPSPKNGEDNAVCYTVTETTTCSICTYKAEKAINGEHVMELVGSEAVEGGVKYSYKCTANGCGNEQSVTVSAENVNFYSAPGQTINVWATGTPNKNNQANKVATGAVMADNSGIFTRIKLYHGGNFILSNGTGSLATGYVSPDTTIEGGAGKYAVLKIRASDDLQRLAFGAYDGQKEFAISGSMPDTDALFRPNGRSTLSIGADENGWVIFVIDLELYAGDWYEVGANITTAAFGLQGETMANTLSGNEYVDVAYFAVCDNWTEIGQVTGNDAKVIYTDWKTTDNDSEKTVSAEIANESQSQQ